MSDNIFNPADLVEELIFDVEKQLARAKADGDLEHIKIFRMIISRLRDIAEEASAADEESGGEI